MAKQISLEEVLDDVRRKPTVPIYPHVAMLLGCSRGSAFAAAHNGTFETIRVNRLLRAITASLRKQLSIEAA